MFLSLLMQFLERFGKRRVRVTGMAQTGVEGMDLVQRLGPVGAIVDLRLPSLPGLAVITLLRERHPNLAIVALTQADSGGFREAARKAGADEFVTKERMVEDLLPAIERAAIHGKGSVGAGVTESVIRAPHA